MIAADWLARLPLIASLPAQDAAAKLREIGENRLADSLDNAPREPRLASASCRA